METTPESGRYEPIHEIGLGGAARVFAGRVSGVARPFALKYLHEDFANNPTHRRRFDREAAIGLEVSGSHPNIVTTRAYDPDAPGGPMLVLDLVGPSLRVQKERLTGDIRAIWWIAAEALRALEQLERCGVVHGDVSPGNLLIAPSGRVLLSDFGNAMRHGDAREVILGGTIPYASPEMLRGERCTIETDIFSIGALLYELLTGAPPFGTDVETVALRQLAGPAELPHTVPREVRGLILGMLAYEEGDRLTLAEAVTYLRRVDASVAVRFGPLAQQWLAECCPSLVDSLTFERADRGPALALWMHERRRRPGPVATAAMGAVVTAAACAGLWLALDASSSEGRKRRAPVAETEQPRNPASLRRLPTATDSRGTDIRVTLGGVTHAENTQPQTQHQVKQSDTAPVRDNSRVTPTDLVTTTETAQSPEAALERKAFAEDIQWAPHPEMPGGGVHYGRVRWKHDSLLVEVRARPPFFIGSAILVDIRAGELHQLGPNAVEIEFRDVREALHGKKWVSAGFGDADGEHPIFIRLDLR